MNMGKKINEYETAGFQISEYDELSSTNTEAERWPKEELKDKKRHFDLLPDSGTRTGNQQMGE